jgi:hypothetical protein
MVGYSVYEALMLYACHGLAALLTLGTGSSYPE